MAFMPTPDDTAAALTRAHEHADGWLASLPTRPVVPTASAEDVLAALGPGLPDGPTPAPDVVDLMATACEPGLTAIPSGRFFGFVMGGTHPAALGADWLTSAWDQNAGLRTVTPAASAMEELAGAWLLDLLGLPADAGVGFVTGGTMANFTCLVAARDAMLRRAGWDVAERGLAGSPGVRVLVGAERHDTVDLTLRYLGLGAPEVVPADDQGRIDVHALAAALGEDDDRPSIVCLQSGNVHSGAHDAFDAAVSLAHAHGAWVHVDGAFGLWAAVSPRLRTAMAGYDLADSWATDAHKTLNVPYDCGVAVVRDRVAHRAALGMHGDYLIRSTSGDPYETVPELSRRARATPVWAVLRALGRSGVTDLVEGLVDKAHRFAEGIAAIPGAEVLNDVVFTQVCAGFVDDATTEAVVRATLEDGTAWTTGSRWRDRSVLRVSVSNHSTTDGDVDRTLAVLRRVAAR